MFKCDICREEINNRKTPFDVPIINNKYKIIEKVEEIFNNKDIKTIFIIVNMLEDKKFIVEKLLEDGYEYECKNNVAIIIPMSVTSTSEIFNLVGYLLYALNKKDEYLDYRNTRILLCTTRRDIQEIFLEYLIECIESIYIPIEDIKIGGKNGSI